MGVLGIVGLDEAQQAVYAALSEEPSSSAEELAAATGLRRGAVASALEGLLGRGLVEALVGTEKRWAMTPPEPALDALVHEAQRELAQVRAHAIALAERARDRTAKVQPNELVSIAEGTAAVTAHYDQLQRGAQVHVLCLDRPPYPATGGVARNPLVEEGVARGVSFRTLYDSVLLDDPASAQRVRWDLDMGSTGRVMTGVPLKLGVSESMAMVPLHTADPQVGLSALVVRPSVLLDSLVALFEALWIRALPLHLDGGSVPDVDPAVVEVVRLLASGMTDAGIARHWGTSERTVRRRISEALEVLGATSRLQVGVLAERKGWLGPPGPRRAADA